jgi:hypothetical protein
MAKRWLMIAACFLAAGVGQLPAATILSFTGDLRRRDQ